MCIKVVDGAENSYWYIWDTREAIEARVPPSNDEEDGNKEEDGRSEGGATDRAPSRDGHQSAD